MPRVFLLVLVRYIHNNPVRAGMVKSSADYPWSSHPVYLGEADVPLVTTDWILSQVSTDKNCAVKLYTDFVLAGMEEETRKEFRQGTIEGRILGNDRFGEDAFGKSAQQISSKITIDHILQNVCKDYTIKPDILSFGGRHRSLLEPPSVVAYIVRETERLSLTKLGQKLKRDLSGTQPGRFSS